MHPSPNILRSTIIECEEKYELVKKRSEGGIFCSKIEAFGQEKGNKKVIYQISDSRDAQKTDKIENLVREILSRPQTQRQVSAHWYLLFSRSAPVLHNLFLHHCL